MRNKPPNELAKEGDKMESVAININIRLENQAQAPHRASPRVSEEAAQKIPENEQPDRQTKTQDIEQARKVLEGRFEVKVEVAQDEETGRSVVRILSRDGERVLRQMPPDAAIELAEAAQKGCTAGIMASVA